MTRLALTLAAVAAFGWLVWHAAGGEHRERELIEINKTNEGIRDAQNACPDDMPWLDRLRCINAQ